MHILQLQHLLADDPVTGCLQSDVSCESKLSCLSSVSSRATSFGADE